LFLTLQISPAFFILFPNFQRTSPLLFLYGFKLNEKENTWEEVYIYKNYKWTFESESAAQIERMTNKEYENSTRLIVEKIDEENIEAKATAPSYFVSVRATTSLPIEIDS